MLVDPFLHPLAILISHMRNRGKKNPYRTIPVKHRLEVLRKRYGYDEESKTFDIVLHYERVSDLFKMRQDHAKVPMMNSDVLDMISDQRAYIPNGFKAKFSPVIDDFEDYNPKIILSAFDSRA